MKIKQQFITKNDCYKAGKKITPKGIMVHSTACPGVLAESWYSRWNKPNHEVAVHAFVDDTVVCQHLPWNHRAWHCARSGNNTHISFEMCEPTNWKTDKNYFIKCYTNAVELAAYLCKQYNLKSSSIVSHKEGNALGIASNHGDPDHWWKYFGYNMNKFRADVDKMLKSGKISVSVTSSTSTSTSNSKPVLSKGDSGNSVKTLQQLLNKVRTQLNLKFDKLTEDGSFGAKTDAAVRLFQNSQKLTIDGVVGAKTWAALEKDYSKTATTTTTTKTRATVKSGSTGADVKYLQQRLNKLKAPLGLKFAKLTEDGEFGAKTLAAVKEFQKARKLIVDGIVGSNTWKALEYNYGDVNANGKVDATDANIVLKSVTGKQKLTDTQKKTADMNADGKVNAVDANTILKRAVGK